MRSKKKLLTFLLASAMAVSMVPAGPRTVHAEEAGSSDETIQKLITPDKPDWYKEQDDSNPYGYKKGVPFRLYEDSELYTFITDPQCEDPSIYIHELYTSQHGKDFLNEDNWGKNVSVDGPSSSILKHWFVSAMPMDLGYNLDDKGNVAPRKTCIAFMGAKKNGQDMDVDVWVYDTKSGKYSDVLTIGTISDIKGNADTDEETLLYQVRNFMTFTVGDYDGDQKDSIIAYAAFSGGPSLVEIEVTGDGEAAPTLAKGAAHGTLLHTGYMKNQADYINDHSWDGHKKLGCSLTSGDVNGDKIDDLVAVSYTQVLPKDGVKDHGEEMIKPSLAVSCGAAGRSGDDLLGEVSYDPVYVATEPVASGDFQDCNESLSVLMPTAVITRTDLTDGKETLAGNQIVVCGYYESILTMKSDGELADIERDSNHASVFAYDYNRENPKCVMADGDTFEPAHTFQKGQIEAEGDGTTISKLAVAAVNIDGSMAPGRLFIGGKFWNIQGKKLIHTVPALDYEYTSSDFECGTDLLDVYIDCMSVQSLSKVGGNYESLAFSLVAVFKEASGATYVDSPYSYTYRAGVAGPAVDQQTSRVVGYFGTEQDELYKFKNFYSSEWAALENVKFDLVNDDFSKINLVMCPVDKEDDGLLIRYNSKDITFADPQILAILQASPYFGVLGQEGAETSYEFESEFSHSDETSHTCSVGIGFSVEGSSPVVDASFKVGYTGETKTWAEQEFSKSITVGFDAVHDSVIVYRTPVVFYSYDVWKPDTGAWEENGLGISYANTPEYQQLSVEDYNSFVEKYNAEGEKRAQEKGSTDPFPALSKLGDGLYLGCEGDPTKYYQGGDAPAGYSVIDDHEHALGYNGGKDFTEFESGESVTAGMEREDGVSFEFEVTFGAEFAKAGPYFSLEDMQGHTVTTVNTEKTGITAGVANLDEESLKAAGYTDDQIRAFSFKWVPATWDSGVKYEYKDKDGNVHLSKNVPIYGYSLTSLTCPLNLSDATLTLDPEEYVYDGTAKAPSVKVELGGAELDPADYTISYLCDGKTVDECIEPGTYTVTATGAGQNIGKTEAEFTIKPADISGAVIKVDPETCVYDGTAKTPKLTVTLGEKTLTQDTDYEVKYLLAGKPVDELLEAGNYTIQVTGKGGYEGTRSASFAITTVDISGAVIRVNPETCEYDGTAKTPKLTVTLGGKTLKQDTDYEVKYLFAGEPVDDLLEIGKYTIEVDGKGNYSGSGSASFAITSVDISKAEMKINPSELEYDGKAKTPEITVTLKGQKLQPEQDYTLSYLLNGEPVGRLAEAGTYTVIAEGEALYTGSVRGTFTIKAKPQPTSIKDANVILSATDFTYNTKAQKPTILTIGGRTLKEGTDYTVLWPTSPVGVGEYTVTIIGNGAYTGVTTATYRIKVKAVTPTVTLKPASVVFNEKAQTPVVTVKVGTTTLNKGTDYTVSLDSGRKNAGTYIVTVNLKGNYSGTTMKKFIIKKAANPLKVKAKKASVSLAKLKKKNQTLAITRAVSFTKKGKGSMTYKLVSVNKTACKKYFKVDSKTGKITIKKGLKKGTYKVKIRMKAAGNGNYKASAVKNLTVQITVK